MPPSYCSVTGCSNSRSPTCSLYCFPKDDAVCKQWVDFCNRPELWKKYEENGPEYLYKSSRICSDHFQSSDFNNPNLFSQGLKKGSVPTLYPASKEPKSRFSLGGLSGIGAGGSGSSPPGNDNDSLLTAMSTKRPMPAHQLSAQQPVAKQQRRSLPSTPSNSASAVTAAAMSGALAGLIQRQQQKEQQRKAFAAALQLQVQNQQQSRSLLASLKLKPNSTTNNNNNNNHIISNNNNNNNGKAAAAQEKLEDERGYGINYVDMDGGDSSEYDSSYHNSMDDEMIAYKQLQQMRAVKAAAAVIPASLKSELTVTPAVSQHSNHNNNNNNNNSTSSSNGTVNYKEKYEQTLKELFACRKIVKNQNNAIKQLQGEIDFLNQLLKEK